MPLPEGLVDITIRRATREQREVAERAMREKDWRTFYANRDALVFVFANGSSAELTASAPGLNEFLRGVRAAIESNRHDTAALLEGRPTISSGTVRQSMADEPLIDVRSIRPVGTPLDQWKQKMNEAVMYRPPPQPAPEGPKTVWDRIGDEEDGL